MKVVVFALCGLAAALFAFWLSEELPDVTSDMDLDEGEGRGRGEA